MINEVCPSQQAAVSITNIDKGPRPDTALARGGQAVIIGHQLHLCQELKTGRKWDLR